MKSHLDFLKTCLEEELIPAGLTINKTSAAGEDDEIFRNKWNGILRDCSQKLVECLIEHYDRHLARNVAATSDRYEILEKTRLWTSADKAQLDEEIHTILEPKERGLNEGKQRKLEKARNNKTLKRTPTGY